MSCHRLFLSAILVCILFFLVNAAPARAQTPVSGSITTDTTWTVAGSPYVLDGEVTIGAGSTLSIEPGVVVKGLDANSFLRVEGNLQADSAVFTSYKDDFHGGDTNNDGGMLPALPGDWGAISYEPGSGGYLSGCLVLYGGGNVIYEVAVNDSSPAISSSTISKSQNKGLYIAGGDPAINGNTFSDNVTDGLESVAPLATVSGNVFSGNGGVAIRLPATIGAGVTGNNYSGNGHDAMYLTGDITASTVWPASNSPYVLEGNSSRQVEVNAPLSIQSGVVVKFGAPAAWTYQESININSSLDASGAVFTSLKDDTHGGDTNGDGSATSPAPGDWNTIVFRAGSSGFLEGCTISYGGDRKSTRLNSSHIPLSRMPSSA